LGYFSLKYAITSSGRRRLTLGLVRGGTTLAFAQKAASSSGTSLVSICSSGSAASSSMLKGLS